MLKRSVGPCGGRSPSSLPAAGAGLDHPAVLTQLPGRGWRNLERRGDMVIKYHSSCQRACLTKVSVIPSSRPHCYLILFVV